MIMDGGGVVVRGPMERYGGGLKWVRRVWQAEGWFFDNAFGPEAVICLQPPLPGPPSAARLSLIPPRSQYKEINQAQKVHHSPIIRSTNHTSIRILKSILDSIKCYLSHTCM